MPGEMPLPTHESAEAVRRGSLIRRYALLVVALLLVAAVGIGLTWYVVVIQAHDEFNTSLGGECEGQSQQRFEQATSFLLIPNHPELADAVDAANRLTNSDTWQMTMRSSGRNGESPTISSVQRSGETLEFVRGDGIRGFVTKDRTIVAGRDSSFWVAACLDPNFMPFTVSDVDCVESRVEDDATIYTYRAIFRDGGCSSAGPSFDFTAVVTAGTLTNWSMEMISDSERRTDEWTMRTSSKIDEPAFWQIVPGWFVNRIDG